MDALYADVRRSVALEERIQAAIQRDGPLTFARFMDLALYAPGLGYYRAPNAPMTRAGDFLTAPETHPVFGALLARFAHAACHALGTPGAMVVEQGAGTGALAAAFGRYWRAAYPGVPLRYAIVEPHEEARARLEERLGANADLVDSLEGLGRFDGLYLSNELPDAFPVHRVRRNGSALEELYVDVEGGRLVERPGPPGTPELAAWLEHAGITLSDGQEMEVSLGLKPWLVGVAGALRRGYMLTLDYGYEAGTAARRPRGTLLAHFRHTANEEYLERIGRQDLTAHVCWTAMERYGAERGLSAVERVSQREFLARWGWAAFGRWRMEQGAPPVELDAIDRLGRREGGMGALDALLMATPGVALPAPEHAGAPRWDAVGA